jgi:hypothetical protein
LDTEHGSAILKFRSGVGAVRAPAAGVRPDHHTEEIMRILILGLLLAVTCPAQDVPPPPKPPDSGLSFEETLKWITERVNLHAKWVDTKIPDLPVKHWGSFRSDGCKVTIEDHSTFSGTNVDGRPFSGGTDLFRTLSLWDVRRVGVSDVPSYVTLFTYGKEQVKVRERRIDSSEEGAWRDGEATIGFGSPEVDNEDLAKRVAKAFEHAVALCRERKPASSEPF